ncbi:MAG: hypothetical protein J7549_02695 [Variovorax sp.]|nr:hypothetical protein [Variovorax sp.]
MRREDPVTPKRPSRWMGVLIALLIAGAAALAMFWKTTPTTPAASSPAASEPKHNAAPATGKSP